MKPADVASDGEKRAPLTLQQAREVYASTGRFGFAELEEWLLDLD